MSIMKINKKTFIIVTVAVIFLLGTAVYAQINPNFIEVSPLCDSATPIGFYAYKFHGTTANYEVVAYAGYNCQRRFRGNLTGLTGSETNEQMKQLIKADALNVIGNRSIKLRPDPFKDTEIDGRGTFGS